MTNIFKGLSEEEILQMLKSNAAFIQQDVETSIPLTKSEIDDLKNYLAEAATVKYEIEGRKKRALEAFAEELNPHKATITECAKELSSGRKLVITDLYAIEDFDNDKMVFYTPDGQVHSTRRLRANEKKQILKISNS